MILEVMFGLQVFLSLHPEQLWAESFHLPGCRTVGWSAFISAHLQQTGSAAGSEVGPVRCDPDSSCRTWLFLVGGSCLHSDLWYRVNLTQQQPDVSSCYIITAYLSVYQLWRQTTGGLLLLLLLLLVFLLLWGRTGDGKDLINRS